jgi:charged multivesicular body protein 4
MYESETAKLQGARITMESQINALESAAINIDVFTAMNQGTKALKAARGNL